MSLQEETNLWTHIAPFDYPTMISYSQRSCANLLGSYLTIAWIQNLLLPRDFRLAAIRLVVFVDLGGSAGFCRITTISADLPYILLFLSISISKWHLLTINSYGWFLASVSFIDHIRCNRINTKNHRAIIRHVVVFVSLWSVYSCFVERLLVASPWNILGKEFSPVKYSDNVEPLIKIAQCRSYFYRLSFWKGTWFPF